MPVIGYISSWHHIMKSSAYEWLTSQSYTATIQTRQTDSDRRVGSDKFLPISVLETWAQAHRAQHTGMYQCLHTSSSSILSFILHPTVCLSCSRADPMLSYFPKETKQKKSSLSVILECHTLRTLLPSIKHAIFICTVAQILVSIPPDSCSDKS